MKLVTKSAPVRSPAPPDPSSVQETMRAVNEALLLGSVRQHELTEAADAANTQLQAEIDARKLIETGLHRVQAQLSDHASELEERVRERTAELTATNRQLEAFVYSIAHDLRAPLRAMQGFSTLLIEEAGVTLTEACRGYADRIGQSAQFMDAMLRDLLAFSRVSQQLIELAPVGLATVVASTLSRLQKDIEDKGVLVQNDGPWPAVLAHEPTLAQVLFNLMDNALKFARPSVTPELNLRTQVLGEFVRIWVQDNGVGIAPDHQEQIFRLFTRLSGEQYPGTGIGLAIVQKGVERMNGRLGVESTLHEGSRFWFELRKV